MNPSIYITTEFPLSSPFPDHDKATSTIECEEVTEEALIDTPRQRPRRRNSCIEFSEKVRVKRVPSLSDLTDRPEELWFQKNEYTAIKQKLRHVIETVGKKEPGHTKHCTRGLEKVFNAQEVQRKRYFVIDSLLDEQEHQRSSGESDDESLGSLCRFITAKCQREAAQRAKQDELDIEPYQRSMRRSCRRSSM